jgi:hypothetical protein
MSISFSSDFARAIAEWHNEADLTAEFEGFLWLVCYQAVPAAQIPVGTDPLHTLICIHQETERRQHNPSWQLLDSS